MVDTGILWNDMKFPSHAITNAKWHSVDWRNIMKTLHRSEFIPTRGLSPNSIFYRIMRGFNRTFGSFSDNFNFSMKKASRAYNFCFISKRHVVFNWQCWTNKDQDKCPIIRKNIETSLFFGSLNVFWGNLLICTVDIFFWTSEDLGSKCHHRHTHLRHEIILVLFHVSFYCHFLLRACKIHV